jgi:lysine-N-methylase
MPGFMKDFRCVAGACDDNCCHDWRLDIDKKTYKKYRQCRDSDLGNELRGKIARVRDAASDCSYAKFVLTQEGNCPFLNEQGLCRIQLTLGEDMLSHTCKNYPRVVHSVDGVLEMSAQLSCPAVTRAVLLPAEPMSFSVIEVNRYWPLQRIFDSSNDVSKRKPERYFTELRAFGISILQDRRYTVPERVVLLGMFFHQMMENDDPDLIPSLIAATSRQYEKAMETKQQLAILQAVPGLQIQLLKLISDHKKEASSVKYRDMYRRALLGLGYTAESASEERLLENYMSGMDTYVKPFFSEHGHMLEHVLVHEYFLMMMPFGAFPSIWNAYVYLVMLYGLIKFFMAGVAREQGYLDVQTALTVVQLLAREILHNEQLIQQIIRILHENNLHTLAYMTILALH